MKDITKFLNVLCAIMFIASLFCAGVSFFELLNGNLAFAFPLVLNIFAAFINYSNFENVFLGGNNETNV
jgi:hypothetical protein